jgi:integrase
MTATANTIPTEANTRPPSLEEYEQMAARRFQDPKPEKVGQWWYLRVWQDALVNGVPVRKRQRIKLGPASLKEREVLKIASEILRSINGGLVSVGSAVNFREYVQNSYIPVELPLLASTTQAAYQAHIDKYLLPTFGACSLRQLTPFVLQRYFSGLPAEGLNHPTIVKVRDALSSVLRSAVKNEFLIKDGLDGIRLPRAKKAKPRKPYITPEQFDRLVLLIPEPYATMVYVAVWTGLRVSEVIALRWEDVHEDSITVDERFCRGDWSEPKSKASNATIGVDPGVITRIHRLKSLTVRVRAGRAVRLYRAVKSAEPGDLVFQSVVAGKEMDDNNILKRHIAPAAKKLGLRVNWRSLRTSHATWLIQSGADVKSVQGQMRHSRSSTTMDIYAQIVPASQRLALKKLAQFAKGSTNNLVPLVVQ